MKRLLLFLFVAVLFSCSKDETNIGVLKYVVSTNHDYLDITYLNDFQVAVTVKENSSNWEHSFKAVTGDIVSVIVNMDVPDNVLTSTSVKIYFDDKLLVDTGCSGNTGYKCTGQTIIP